MSAADRASGSPSSSGTDSAEQDDFEPWKICWEVNLAFYEVASGPQTCLVCWKTNDYGGGVYRSTLWMSVRCWSGHGQGNFDACEPGAAPGICARCDQDYLLDVLKGKHACRRKGCRRLVRVNEGMVRKRLASAPAETLNSFSALVERSKVFECMVHCDEVACSDDGPPAPTCAHDQNVCDDCVRTEFEGKIRANRLKDLKCLDPDCRKEVPSKRVRELVGPEARKIYDKKLALTSISKNPKFRWCKCGSGQIHAPGETSPEWKCLNCPRQNCYVCNDIDITTCAHLRAVNAARKHQQEQQRRAARAALEKKQAEERENTAATREHLARTSKLCPKKDCGLRIARAAGCGHMTCRGCSTEFCWVCKVIWKNRVPLHLDTCSLAATKKTTLAALDKSDYAKGWQDDSRYDDSADEGIWLLDGHR
ncbi:hypothetical protein B0T26DRAFT_745292 [Lasiosphaeria miniovina]|uniref:RING-type domain-containing protein n=1 Tax=Lasiosphaeria miniovina TaxID=1954250 RepID=A0AA40BFE7_9PEZI|nr:uncharacterized protein B0T26DRAFT_745292 [Lasiosphaeria miniovina]KAK0733227.1 hypothetical protein B0T26DRAFT_745292 [Lasiosphaeria miniovina]